MMSRSFGPYNSLDEFIDREVTFADLLHELGKLPRRDVLRWVLGLSERLEHKDSDQPEAQLALLQQLLHPDLSSQIQVTITETQMHIGVLFHRRQIWFVLQMALLACKD